MAVSRVVHLIGVILRLFGLTLLAPAGRGAVVRRAVGRARAFWSARSSTTAIGHLMRAADRCTRTELRRVDALTVVAGILADGRARRRPALPVGRASPDRRASSSRCPGLTTTGATIFDDFSRYGRGIFFWRAPDPLAGRHGRDRAVRRRVPQARHCRPRALLRRSVRPDRRAPGAADSQDRGRALAGLRGAHAAAGRSRCCSPACRSTSRSCTPSRRSRPAASRHIRSRSWATPARRSNGSCIVFMFLAGANFALHYRVLRGRPGDLWRDEEFRAYGGIVVWSPRAS